MPFKYIVQHEHLFVVNGSVVGLVGSFAVGIVLPRRTLSSRRGSLILSTLPAGGWRARQQKHRPIPAVLRGLFNSSPRACRGDVAAFLFSRATFRRFSPRSIFVVDLGCTWFITTALPPYYAVLFIHVLHVWTCCCTYSLHDHFLCFCCRSRVLSWSDFCTILPRMTKTCFLPFHLLYMVIQLLFPLDAIYMYLVAPLNITYVRRPFLVYWASS